jgi:hypothetical protein
MATEYKLLFGLENQFNGTTGTPLIGGYLYAYKASDHITKKNIAKIRVPTISGDYYANPLNLGADGCPPAPYLFYLADDEAYYFVLTNSSQNPLNPPDLANIVRTWDNVEPNEGSSPEPTEIDHANYIQNAQFRFHRYASQTQADFTASVNNYVADTGWYFYTNSLPTTMSIIFNEFTPGQTAVPDNPRYYMSFACSVIGAGQTSNDVFQKMDDVRSFSNSTISLSFWMKSSTNSQVEIIIKQNFGSGGSAEIVMLNSVQLTTTWVQKTIQVAVPSITGKTIGTGDYFAVGIRAPLNAISAFDISDAQLNRGSTLFAFNYETKEIEAESKRTWYMPDPTDNDLGLPVKWNGSAFAFDHSDVGKVIFDFRSSITYAVLADNTTYSTLDYYPGTKLTYARLYDKWEVDFPSYGGNYFGYGLNGFNPFTQYTNIITFSIENAGTAITAWADNNTTFTFTQLHNATGYPFVVANAFDGQHTGGTFTTYLAEGIVKYTSVTSVTAGTSGWSITTGGGYFVHCTSAAGMAGKYFMINTGTGNYYVWFNVDNVGPDPAPGGSTGIRVNLLGTDTLQQVAYKLHRCTANKGIQMVTCVAASALSGGEYFHFYNQVKHFVGYIIKEGVGADPAVGGTTSIPINIFAADTSTLVAQRVNNALRRIYFNVPDMRGMFIRGTDYGRGLDPNAADRYHYHGVISGDNPGSYQRDDFRSHHHLIQMNDGSSGSDIVGTAYNLGSAATSATDNTGDSESRPVNIGGNFFVNI